MESPTKATIEWAKNSAMLSQALGDAIHHHLSQSDAPKGRVVWKTTVSLFQALGAQMACPFIQDISVACYLPADIMSDKISNMEITSQISQNIFEFCTVTVSTLKPLYTQFCTLYDELIVASDAEVPDITKKLNALCADGFEFCSAFESQLKTIIDDTCIRYLQHLGGDTKSTKIMTVLTSAGTKVIVAGAGLGVGIAAGLITAGASTIIAGTFAGKAFIDAVTEVGLMVKQLSQDTDSLAEQFVEYVMEFQSDAASANSVSAKAQEVGIGMAAGFLSPALSQLPSFAKAQEAHAAFVRALNELQRARRKMSKKLAAVTDQIEHYRSQLSEGKAGPKTDMKKLIERIDQLQLLVIEFKQMIDSMSENLDYNLAYADKYGKILAEVGSGGIALAGVAGRVGGAVMSSAISVGTDLPSNVGQVGLAAWAQVPLLKDAVEDVQNLAPNDGKPDKKKKDGKSDKK